MARKEDKTDHQRISDLRAALKRANADDMISLEGCADIWGVSKPRFVNVRKRFATFPDPIPDGNKHLYPAREALQGMLDNLERIRSDAAERAKRQAAILGGEDLEEALLHHTPQELVTLNRLQADIAQREHAQGLYIPIAEVQRVAGAVFSEISDFMSRLSNLIDPHGRLDPADRVLIDKEGRERLLEVHARLKVLLSDHADTTDLRKTGSAGKARSRRKR